MRKPAAIFGSTLFFLIAPFTFAFVLPWWIAGWQIGAPMFGNVLFPAAGVVLVLLGLGPLVESFARFALEGLGTPAPIAPPEHLIVTGYYRYVRNPMYVGVELIILGNALITGDSNVLLYGVAVSVAFSLFVVLYEEPTLRRQFGAEYEAYCRNVPRWIPRFTPWTKATSE